MPSHKIPLGSLVEIKSGARLFVVHRYLDCDAWQTPLYCLSAREDDITQEREGFFNSSWVKGIPENAMRPINSPVASWNPIDGSIKYLGSTENGEQYKP